MEGVEVEELEKKSTLMQKIEQLQYIEGGVLKDFVRRTLIGQDEFWWDKEPSEWKVQVMHPWAPEGSYVPNYWMNRALDLCRNDIVHTHFGLGFLELMDLDPATFEIIEERVTQIVKRHNDAIPDSLKQDLKNQSMK